MKEHRLALAKWIHDRVLAGKLEVGRVKVAAYLGDAAAISVLGSERRTMRSLNRIRKDLAGWSDWANVALCYTLALTHIGFFAERHQETELNDVLRLVGEWMDGPNPELERLLRNALPLVGELCDRSMRYSHGLGGGYCVVTWRAEGAARLVELALKATLGEAAKQASEAIDVAVHLHSPGFTLSQFSSDQARCVVKGILREIFVPIILGTGEIVLMKDLV